MYVENLSVFKYRIHTELVNRLLNLRTLPHASTEKAVKLSIMKITTKNGQTLENLGLASFPRPKVTLPPLQNHRRGNPHSTHVGQLLSLSTM